MKILLYNYCKCLNKRFGVYQQATKPTFKKKIVSLQILILSVKCFRYILIMFSWNKYPLLRILIPFIAGIFIAFYTDFAFPVWILLIVSVLGVFSVVVLSRFRQYKNRWISGILIVVSIFSLALSYTKLLMDNAKPSPALIENKDKQLFTASVIEAPTVKAKTIKLIVRIEEYKHVDNFQTDYSKAIVHVERDEQAERIVYGDKLLFYSYLNEPPKPKNPQEFNYKRYLSAKRIHLQSYIAAHSWKKISKKNGNPLIAFAIELRNKFLKTFKDCGMDTQEYGVIAAMLLGDEDDLDPDLLRSYSATGVVHILSVSGLHVGIIYMFIAFFLRFLEKTKKQQILRFVIILSTVWLYACITGLAPPILRSATMFTFVAVGGLLDRRTNGYNSLLVSLIFLLILNPLQLFNVGFQLSYLAVFGIVWVQPPLRSLYNAKTKAGKYVWDIVTVSLAAQLLTAPLAILYFHQFPNYFLLTNIAAITLTTFVMGFGVAVLALSFWRFAYEYLSLGLKYSIKFMNWIIIKVEALPYSVTANIDLSFLQIILIYLVIILLLSAFFYKNKSCLFQGLACAIVVLGMHIHKQITVNQQKEIVFYNIKSGYAVDCINGLNSTLVCDSITANDRQIYDYSIKNNHIYHRINKINKLQNQHFMSFHGKTVFVLSEAVYPQKNTPKIKIDYLLLTHKNIPLETMRNVFDFQLLILNSNLPYYKSTQLKQICQKENIAFHDLKSDGAFCVKF